VIILKSPEEVEKIRASCQIVADALQHLEKVVEPGITTLELNDIAEQFLMERGAAPAFKGYRGFPMSLCASINEEVVHGIPSAKRKLQEGDVISLDLGSLYEGYYGDAAITVGVEKITESAKKLLAVTRTSLESGLREVRENNWLSDISHAIQTAVEREGFSVVRIFVGHGIGTSLHEEPQIPNFGPPGRGPRLKEGMVLAVEPMVNVGTSDVRILDDNWTVVTQDGSLSAHFEHTVAVTKDGCDVLSRFH